jgi:hypothetical protein
LGRSLCSKGSRASLLTLQTQESTLVINSTKSLSNLSHSLNGSSLMSLSPVPSVFTANPCRSSRKTINSAESTTTPQSKPRTRDGSSPREKCSSTTSESIWNLSLEIRATTIRLSILLPLVKDKRDKMETRILIKM